VTGLEIVFGHIKHNTSRPDFADCRPWRLRDIIETHRGCPELLSGQAQVVPHQTSEVLKTSEVWVSRVSTSPRRRVPLRCLENPKGLPDLWRFAWISA